MRFVAKALRNISDTFPPLYITESNIKELPPGGMSLWEYSKGYRTPGWGAFKAYSDARNNGASRREAFGDAVRASHTANVAVAMTGAVAAYAYGFF